MILDLLIISIIVLMFYLGMKKGFVKEAFNLIKFMLIIYLVPKFTDIVISLFSLDEENVKIFFMFLCPEEDTQEYLKVLARISRWIKEDRFRESLLKAKTGKEIIDIIKAEEV